MAYACEFTEDYPNKSLLIIDISLIGRIKHDRKVGADLKNYLRMFQTTYHKRVIH